MLTKKVRMYNCYWLHPETREYVKIYSPVPHYNKAELLTDLKLAPSMFASLNSEFKRVGSVAKRWICEPKEMVTMAVKKEQSSDYLICFDYENSFESERVWATFSDLDECLYYLIIEKIFKIEL